MFTDLTSCSKEVVNEEALLTKGMPGGDGTQDSPFLPGHIPFINSGSGSSDHYFKLVNYQCAFMTENPAGKNGMTISAIAAPVSKKLTYEMTRVSDGKRLAINTITTNDTHFSIVLRLPAIPTPPGLKPNYPVFSAERVIIQLRSSVQGTFNA